MDTSKSKREWQEKVLRPSVKRFPEQEERFLTTFDIEIAEFIRNAVAETKGK